jgi:hypothetical protein
VLTVFEYIEAEEQVNSTKIAPALVFITAESVVEQAVGFEHGSNDHCMP